MDVEMGEHCLHFFFVQVFVNTWNFLTFFDLIVFSPVFEGFADWCFQWYKTLWQGDYDVGRLSLCTVTPPPSCTGKIDPRLTAGSSYPPNKRKRCNPSLRRYINQIWKTIVFFFLGISNCVIVIHRKKKNNNEGNKNKTKNSRIETKCSTAFTLLESWHFRIDSRIKRIFKFLTLKKSTVQFLILKSIVSFSGSFFLLP